MASRFCGFDSTSGRRQLAPRTPSQDISHIPSKPSRSAEHARSEQGTPRMRLLNVAAASCNAAGALLLHNHLRALPDIPHPASSEAWPKVPATPGLCLLHRRVHQNGLRPPKRTPENPRDLKTRGQPERCRSALQHPQCALGVPWGPCRARRAVGFAALPPRPGPSCGGNIMHCSESALIEHVPLCGTNTVA